MQQLRLVSFCRASFEYDREEESDNSYLLNSLPLEEVKSHRKTLPILSIIIPIILSLVINTGPEMYVCACLCDYLWMLIDLLSILNPRTMRPPLGLIGYLDRLTGFCFLSRQLRLGLCLHKFCRDKPLSGGEAALYIKPRTSELVATISKSAPLANRMVLRKVIFVIPRVRSL